MLVVMFIYLLYRSNNNPLLSSNPNNHFDHFKALILIETAIMTVKQPFIGDSSLLSDLVMEIILRMDVRPK